MSQIARSWLAFAGIGTGVIHFALVISSPLPLGIVLTVLGIAEFGWGVGTLSRDRILAPRIARVGALAPVILWSVIVLAATMLDAPRVASYVNFFPMAIATIFELVIAVAITVRLRREPAPSKTAPAGRYLVGLFVGAMLVASLATPALAYTQAGLNNPHASHYFGNADHAGH